MLSNTLMAGDVTCIQVHPTFLYESLWCLAVLSALLAVTFRMKKRKQGTVFLLYLFGYGLGRLWIEGLRTDQLKLAFTGLPVSQMLSLVMVITSAAVLIIRGRRGRQNT
jgi:phosphatidylglycerol:prolipoprotein diacylglycerol transferase